MRVKKNEKKEDNKGVRYEILCQKCKKKLHRGDGKDTFQKIKSAVCSMNMNNAIARHSWSTGHRANWEGSTIIGLKKHPVKRKIL